MGSFADNAILPANPVDDNMGWMTKLDGKYPSLASALSGEIGWEKNGGKRPPLSLIIFTRDGRLRFTLSNPEWNRTYHCQITDPSDPLGSVEMALAANQGEWVTKKKF